jgi:DNA-binding XRE family transcriptional regulator
MLVARRSSLFPKSIQLLLESHFEGNVQALARFLGVNRYTIIAWKRGTQSPSLLLLADVTRKVKVASERLLCSDLQAGDFKTESGVLDQPIRRLFIAPPKLDYENIRQVLGEAAKDDAVAALSLSKLAGQLGCRQTTLQRRFPDLVNRIKERYRQACASRKEERAKLRENRVPTTAACNLSSYKGRPHMGLSMPGI